MGMVRAWRLGFPKQTIDSASLLTSSVNLAYGTFLICWTTRIQQSQAMCVLLTEEFKKKKPLKIGRDNFCSLLKICKPQKFCNLQYTVPT